MSHEDIYLWASTYEDEVAMNKEQHEPETAYLITSTAGESSRAGHAVTVNEGGICWLPVPLCIPSRGIQVGLVVTVFAAGGSESAVPYRSTSRTSHTSAASGAAATALLPLLLLLLLYMPLLPLPLQHDDDDHCYTKQQNTCIVLQHEIVEN